ncbi:hypothetical protein DESC_780480 [Desulfosarcina cetonica]|nr:hypothetical protein DESC_780480 [Desulfosarcina cetonica]
MALIKLRSQIQPLLNSLGLMGIPVGDDRHRAFAKHLIGHRPHQDVLDVGPSLGAHHKHVHRFLLDDPEKFVDGLARMDDNPDPIRGKVRSAQHRLDLLLAGSPDIGNVAIGIDLIAHIGHLAHGIDVPGIDDTGHEDIGIQGRSQGHRIVEYATAVFGGGQGNENLLDLAHQRLLCHHRFREKRRWERGSSVRRGLRNDNKSRLGQKAAAVKPNRSRCRSPMNRRNLRVIPGGGIGLENEESPFTTGQCRSAHLQPGLDGQSCHRLGSRPGRSRIGADRGR